MDKCQKEGEGAGNTGTDKEALASAAAVLRIVLVGKSGSGKSATGNSILCRYEFKSQVGAQHVTRQCQAASRTWNGRSILVVDTPPIFEAIPETPDLYKDIGDCYLLSSPGPHVLLLVIRLGRFTAQDIEAARRVKEVFGPRAMRHVIILFTHKEDLEGMPVAQYLLSVKNSMLNNLLRECGRRFCGFNNRATGTEQLQQLAELMAQVEGLERELQGGFLSTRLSQKAQLLQQQRSAGGESPDAHKRYLALVQSEMVKQVQGITKAQRNSVRNRLCRHQPVFSEAVYFWIIYCGVLLIVIIMIFFVF